MKRIAIWPSLIHTIISINNYNNTQVYRTTKRKDIPLHSILHILYLHGLYMIFSGPKWTLVGVVFTVHTILVIF